MSVKVFVSQLVQVPMGFEILFKNLGDLLCGRELDLIVDEILELGLTVPEGWLDVKHVLNREKVPIFLLHGKR